MIPPKQWYSVMYAVKLNSLLIACGVWILGDMIACVNLNMDLLFYTELVLQDVHD